MYDEKTAHPVEILRIDEIRRAEASQPCQEVAQTDRRTNRPRAQPGAGKLGGNGVASEPDKCVVKKEEEAGEGDDAVASGGGTGCRRSGQRHGEKAETLEDSPEH